jgi:hypothetical protein
MTALHRRKATSRCGDFFRHCLGDDASPVGGIVDAPNETLTLQAVEEVGDRGGGKTCVLGDLPGAHRAGALEHPESFVVGQVKPESASHRGVEEDAGIAVLAPHQDEPLQQLLAVA